MAVGLLVLFQDLRREEIRGRWWWWWCRVRVRVLLTCCSCAHSPYIHSRNMQTPCRKRVDLAVTFAIAVGLLSVGLLWVFYCPSTRYFFVSGYCFHFRSLSQVIFGFCEVAGGHLVADLPLSAASQYVGYTVTMGARRIFSGVGNEGVW